MDRFDWPGSWTTELPDNEQIVGVVAAHDFPEPDLVVEVVRAGLDRGESITWAVRDRDDISKTALARCAVVPVVARLNQNWKWSYDLIGFEQLAGRKRLVFTKESGDRRAECRISEMLNRCDRILLFTTPTNKTLSDFRDPLWANKVKIIERGAQPVKRPYRKGKARD